MKQVINILTMDSAFLPKQNPLKKLSALLLTLSFTTGSAYASVKTVKYTVKRGDSLYTIAHENHTTIVK